MGCTVPANKGVNMTLCRRCAAAEGAAYDLNKDTDICAHNGTKLEILANGKCTAVENTSPCVCMHSAATGDYLSGATGSKVCTGCPVLKKVDDIAHYDATTCAMCGVANLSDGGTCHYENATDGAVKFTILNACEAGKKAEANCVCTGKTKKYLVKKGKKCDAKLDKVPSADGSNANSLLSGLALGFLLLLKL